MALTEEQLKNLKPGDIIDIRGFVNLPLCNGNILVELRYEFDHRTLPAYQRISTEFISLPPEQPKHDPCRLFKSGDIVQYVERDGRSYVDAPPVGAICRVIVGEDSVGMVSVEFKFSEYEEAAVHDVPFYHLELVTPVEEIEPYIIREYADFYAVEKDGAQYSIFFKGSYHDNAKAAAETECKRLNDEWRKEQNNG